MSVVELRITTGVLLGPKVSRPRSKPGTSRTQSNSVNRPQCSVFPSTSINMRHIEMFGLRIYWTHRRTVWYFHRSSLPSSGQKRERVYYNRCTHLPIHTASHPTRTYWLHVRTSDLTTKRLSQTCKSRTDKPISFQAQFLEQQIFLRTNDCHLTLLQQLHFYCVPQYRENADTNVVLVLNNALSMMGSRG
jgi:hypothetical protein